MVRADAATEAGIRAAYETWFAALEAGDIERALSAVTPDVVHQGPSGAARVGREALGDALATFLASYAERVQWTLDVTGVAHHEADVHVREVAIVRPRAGGRNMRVTGWHHGRLRRETDGAWRISLDVSTLDGPPEAVDE